MQHRKILFGFDEPRFEKAITSYLKSNDCEIDSTVKLTKGSIRDFLLGNPDYDTAVLLEVLNNSSNEKVSKFTADELAQLTDEREINVIVILNENLRGTQYMHTLYAAGITSAIYQKGRRGGATVKDVCTLILHKRNNREARQYYGIANAPIKLNFLSNDAFLENYNNLLDPNMGCSVIERFVNICRYLSPDQVEDFIRRLPEDITHELRKYEEFYRILDTLKRNGIHMDIKRPRRVSIGLLTPENMDAISAQNEYMEPILQLELQKSSKQNGAMPVEMPVDKPHFEPDVQLQKDEVPAKERKSKAYEIKPFADIVSSVFGNESLEENEDEDSFEDDDMEGTSTASEYYDIDDFSQNILKEALDKKNNRKYYTKPDIDDDEERELELDVTEDDFFSAKKKTRSNKNLVNYILVGLFVFSMLLVVIGLVLIFR